MRDLRADWRKWTPNERLFGVLALTALLIAASLPLLIHH